MAAASGRLCHHSPTRCSSLLGRECHLELQGWAGSSACSSAVQVSTDGLGPAPPFTNGPLRGWATPERKSQQSRTAGSQSVSPSQTEAHLASCKEGHFQNTGRWEGHRGTSIHLGVMGSRAVPGDAAPPLANVPPPFPRSDFCRCLVQSLPR